MGKYHLTHLNTGAKRLSLPAGMPLSERKQRLSKRIYQGLKGIVCAALALVLMLNTVQANIIRSKSVTGNWSAPSSWVGGVVPGASDSVVIVSGADITADKSYPASTESPLLRVNGTLTIAGNGTTSLLNFTSVVITCPGQIYWTQNGNLTFSAGTSVDVNGYTSSGTCGLQPVGGSASAALVIGSITVAVSNDYSNNAAYSFREFNMAGGLASFLLASNSPICYTPSFNVTLTPTNNVTPFNCVWSVNEGGSVTPGTVSGINSIQTVTVTPTKSTTAKIYTITCTIYRQDDNDPIVTKTITVTVNPAPTAAAALAATLCVGNSATINATTTNATAYQWQFSTDGGTSWSELPDASPYSGAKTNALGVSSTDILMAANYYRVKVNNTFQDYTGTFCTATSASVPLQFTNQWLGTNSHDWSTASNWVNNALPVFNTGCPTVAIPAVSTLPQLSSNTTVSNLTIAPGASVDLNGKTLTISGTFSGSSTGYLKGSASSGLAISGDAGTLYFDQTTNGATNALKNLNVSSGSAKLGNALNIAAGSAASPGMLTVNGTLDANDLLTLKSDANSTAQVGASYGTIKGEVTVERYFPALRAWRFVAVPFSKSSQTINQAWQEGNIETGLNCPTQASGTPGYGTSITYANSVANGFDVNNTGNTSIKVFKNNAWTVPASTLTTNIASPYTAYSLFVRGDRTTCLTYAAPATSTTLRPRGELNQAGGAAVNKSFTGNSGEYIMISNPYAASIDITSVVSTASNGIDKGKFLVWDPNLGGTAGVGGYVTYSGGVKVPASSGYSASTKIQSGQAFMVQLSSSSTGGSVSFNETDKVVYNDVNAFGIQAQRDKPSAVYVNLLDTAKVIMDGVATAFGKPYSAAVDSADAIKRWNEEIENMAIFSHQKYLAIEFRPDSVKTDTSFLKLYLRQHPYILQVFSQSSIAGGLPSKAWLVDKYLDTKTEINLSDTTLYSFTPNKDTNSYRNRFMLVFENNQQTQAPKVIAASTGGDLHVFPNPVINQSFSVELGNFPEGNYQVFIYDSKKGTLKLAKELRHVGKKGTYNIKLPSNTPAGVHELVLLKDGQKVRTISLLVAK